MWEDEILEEIYQIREDYAKSFNYDLDAIFEDLYEKQEASDRRVVRLSEKEGEGRSLRSDEAKMSSGRYRYFMKDL